MTKCDNWIIQQQNGNRQWMSFSLRMRNKKCRCPKDQCSSTFCNSSRLIILLSWQILLWAKDLNYCFELSTKESHHTNRIVRTCLNKLTHWKLCNSSYHFYFVEWEFMSFLFCPMRVHVIFILSNESSCHFFFCQWEFILSSPNSFLKSDSLSNFQTESLFLWIQQSWAFWKWHPFIKICRKYSGNQSSGFLSLDISYSRSPFCIDRLMLKMFAPILTAHSERSFVRTFL